MRSELRLRAPLGRVDSVRSSLSGDILEYYTPHHLSVLVAQCVGPSAEPHDSMNHAALALVRSASRRRSGFDPTFSRIAAHALLSSRGWATVPELIALAGELDPRNVRLRDEAAYSGASRAAAANHIYTPNSRLPELLSDMANVLATAAPNLDPVALAAMVGFFGLHAHPFVDANGRWTRLLVLSTGAVTSAPWEATATAVFLTAFNETLCSSVFPNVRKSGAHDYLALARAFEVELRCAFSEYGLQDVTNTIHREFTQAANRRSTGRALLMGLFSQGEMRISSARMSLGLSDKAMRGLISRASASPHAGVEVNGDQVSVAPLLEQVDAAINRAIEKIAN